MKKLKPEAFQDLDQMMTDLKTMRDKSKALNEDIVNQQDLVLTEMDRLGVTTHAIVKGGKQVAKATRVQNIASVYDEPRLKKKLGAKLWDKVSTKRLDRNKLDAFIASGELKQSVIAECITEKPGSPFIRIT